MGEEKEERFYQKDISNNVWTAEEQIRMAAERTYLSWIRTGLTSMGIGIAIAKFIIFRSSFNKYTGRWAGLLLLFWSLGIFMFALLSYRKSYQRLRIFQANQHPLRPMVVITTILICITLILIVIIVD